MNDEFEPESDHAPEPGADPAIESDPEAGAELSADAEASEELNAAPDEDSAPAEPLAKLERLQKILAQAGIASRRHAEQLISEGRVQVNGQVVSTLGSKADPARDHIRVDGKLIHGAERLRYFMLNKPKGYVTTVSDPEGRPTVMQFFEKTRERVFPVGRLDYESEGLLLMTNDGALANQLTRAASGVEKTYLVKVSGQPAEEELDRLREGVRIDRGDPGEGKVQTAPASIRRVRQGDNPWFEVVLIEGRNRELRKMFQEIGHYVEKIRRVGYGPLVLDIEPGKVRELEPGEIAGLRRAAEGKHKPARLRESRHDDARPRDRADAGNRPSKKAPRDDRGRGKTFDRRPAPPFREREGRPHFGGERHRPDETRNRQGFAPKPAWRDENRRPSRSDSRTGPHSGPRSDRPAPRPDRERPFGERRGRFERSESPRGGGFGRRPAFDRSRNAGQSRDSARDDARSGVSRSKPDERPRERFDKPASQQRPQRPFGADKRGAGERPQKNDQSGGGTESRRSFPPRTGSARTGPPRTGPSRSGPSRTGPQRSGPPRSGSARSGSPRSGPPRPGSQRSGSQRSGSRRPGPGKSGPPRSRPPRPK